ncbi:MAG TPA: LamG-like jellyroll fold domain-containing protein [Dinghuibacter sp.]|uniref:RHS repeat domain-containing protein n=1 Tax=Dinghuibacter sp. TaxID=2024697 RepID=UPI002C5FC167|nr:LamG-like jellyroll fold domain-containing protein [Dinghuibacter sp.]HTJ11853.1 LamG-like jellyroll fold domain-containing protein [Dinghuibacter sp.]
MSIIHHIGKTAITTLLLLLSGSRCLASQEPYFNELRGAQVAQGQTLTVTDDKFRSMTPGQWSALQNISVRNVVTFELNFDTSVFFYARPFTCTLNATIHFYADQGDTSEETASPQTVNLTIRYDTAKGKAYTAVALYRFSGAYKFSVVINSINSPELGSQLPSIFRLTGRTVIDRKYPFTDNSTDVTAFQQPNPSQLQLGWTPANYPGAETFDLEWTFIDSASQRGYSILNNFGNGATIPQDTLAYWFTNNATRINTSASGYTINLHYNAGWVLFRVRGVQIHYPDNIRYEGAWNYQASPAAGGGVQSAAVPVQWHERWLNWSYTGMFTEDGKSKELVNYQDAMSRTRQSVTLNNSDRVASVAEAIMDDMGRTALAVMPGIAPDTTIHYFRDFNRNAAGQAYSYADFRQGAGCQVIPSPMSTASGASAYYSKTTPFPQAFHAAYVPNAHGYPFAVIQYTPDNTGRLEQTGDVDTAFQPGGAHTTRYFYGKPQQVELDRLFGSEAGLASHFVKNMIADPNGLVTVTYGDANGRVVATAVAGRSPSNLDSLSTSVGAVTPVSETLLRPEDFTQDVSSYSLSATTTLLAAMTGNYHFSYEVDPLALVQRYGLHNQNQLCSACYYDLVIHVKDNCSNILYQVDKPAGQVFDTTCGAQAALIDSFAVALPAIGEYYLDYSLVISRNALNYFDSVNLAKNTNILKFDAFLTQELQKEDFTPCFADCSTCMAKLGTADGFLNRFRGLYKQDSIPFAATDSAYLLTVYTNLLQQCQANITSGACGESACQQKLDVIEQDVTPGGQYALYDGAYNLVQPSINVLQYYASVSGYVDANGNPATVTLQNIDGQDSITVAPQQLSLAQFIQYFQPSWAAALAPYHPEYCLYLWCTQNSGSYTFDDMLQQLPDGNTAVTLGYYSLTDFAALLEKDPFFAANPSYYQPMYDSLRLFSRSLLGTSQPDRDISGMIQSVLYCTNQTNGFTACSVSPSCRSADMEWTLYLPWYLNLKQEFYAQARAANPQFANCPNCHIGQDPSGLLTMPYNPVNYSPTPGPTCNTCSAGVYRQTGRPGVSYYIEYGTPASPPTDLPSGYGNAAFYATFNTPGGNPANAAMGCNFANVWVAEYDSACCGQPGGLCLCSAGGRPSSYCAPATPTDSLYATKRRVFATYVNPTSVLGGIQGSNPQQGSDSTRAQVAAQGASLCDAEADNWMSLLTRCTADPNLIAQLRAALVSICSAGYDAKHPYGSSSLPPGATGPYSTFEQAITGIIGSGAINAGCTSELLSMPYPYGLQPVGADPVIQQSTASTCAQVAAMQSAYAASGFTGTFSQYLQSILGADDQMSDANVADLLNSCSNCNGVLQSPVTLPAALVPGSTAAVPCSTLQGLVSSFQSYFPGLTTDNPDYENLFTNYLNHRTGFALGFDDYQDFLGTCSGNALLYNKPLTTAVQPNDNACVQDLFADAETNAQTRFVAYIDSVRAAFRQAYLTRCMGLQPTLGMNANLDEYHYTLYYYDQAGNLIKTVPPAGVALLNGAQTDSVAQDRLYNRTGCYEYADELQFTGAGAMSFTNQPFYSSGAAPFTLEAYMYFPSAGSQGILSHYHPTTGFGGQGYSLFLRNDSLVFHMAFDDTSYLEAEAPPIEQLTPLGQWAHVVVERIPTGDSALIPVIYVNGIPAPLAVQSHHFDLTSNISASAPLLIGANGSSFFGGRIKQVRIYQRDLPAAEVLQNYFSACLLPASQTAMVCWMPMAEGSGDISDILNRDTAAWTQTGVDPDWINRSLAVYPAHRMATTYHYNSLDESTLEQRPDQDSVRLFYDLVGRMFATQHTEQVQPVNGGAAGRYAYVVRDGIGRVVEAGETSGTTDLRTVNTLDTNAVKAWLTSGSHTQVTHTYYDAPAQTLVFHPSITAVQDNLRDRIASVVYWSATGNSTYDQATHYSYDLEGNLQTMWQEVAALRPYSDSGIKRIDYDYDLVSGKINQETYQAGKGDQFVYKYDYDADNRLVRARTSRDSILWTNDADYYYYLHGLLGRVEYGQYKVQGLDFAYTLQGWPKALNGMHLSSTADSLADIGGDGRGALSTVARDVVATGMGYFPGDYDPRGGDTATAMAVTYQAATPAYGVTGNGVYTGNPTYMTVALSQVDSSTMAGYSYRYDQLGRLVQMRKHGNIPGSARTWDNTSAVSDYQESVAYDPNGNIQSYFRNGTSAAGHTLAMDQLSYRYQPGTNRLDHIQDNVPGTNYNGADITTQDTLNYSYDGDGRIIRDAQAGLTNLQWNVGGKVAQVSQSHLNATITYAYDAMGRRVYEHRQSDSCNTEDMYIRDAQGRTLAIYGHDVRSGQFTWKEQDLIAAGRMGTWSPNQPPPQPVSWSNAPDSMQLGYRMYELSNHMGSILATVSDKKTGVAFQDTLVGYYVADVLSQQDYYPFGMAMPLRGYASPAYYRYAFQGMEKDDAWQGAGNTYTAEYWAYDPRVGRRFDPDPFTLAPYSSYMTLGDAPTMYSDPSGLDWYENKKTHELRWFNGHKQRKGWTYKGKDVTVTTRTTDLQPVVVTPKKPYDKTPKPVGVDLDGLIKDEADYVKDAFDKLRKEYLSDEDNGKIDKIEDEIKAGTKPEEYLEEELMKRLTPKVIAEANKKAKDIIEYLKPLAELVSKGGDNKYNPAVYALWGVVIAEYGLNLEAVAPGLAVEGVKKVIDEQNEQQRANDDEFGIPIGQSHGYEALGRAMESYARICKLLGKPGLTYVGFFMKEADLEKVINAGYLDLELVKNNISLTRHEGDEKDYFVYFRANLITNKVISTDDIGYIRLDKK